MKTPAAVIPARSMTARLGHVLNGLTLTLILTCVGVVADPKPEDPSPITERLILLTDLQSRSTHVEAGVMKPFDVYVVAERSAELPELSMAVFKLSIPDGILVIGQDVLVESLVSLGTPLGGMHLTFQCETKAVLPVLHLRLLSRKPLDGAIIRVQPEAKTNFLGLVACRSEKYVKYDVEESSITIDIK